MPIKFIFTADSHLRSSSMGSAERGVDFFRSLMSVVAIAEQEGVTTILHGGDLLDATRLTALVSDQLFQVDLACRRAGTRMLTISGNHDASKPHWIENLEKMHRMAGADTTDDGPGIHLVDHQTLELRGSKKGETLRVLALPSMSSEEFLKCATAGDADILMWHGAIREFCGYPDPAALSMQDLPVNSYDGILLGDIHIRRFEPVNDCLVGYPGATEVAKQGDPIDCTCTLMEWEKGKGLKIVRHIPVGSRPVFPRRIDSEEKLQQVMAEIRAIGDQPALFLINYADALESVADRLKLCAGPETMIRSASYTIGDQVSMARVFGVSTTSMESKPPEAFLVGLVTPGSDLHRAAALLLNPGADHATILRDFVTTLEGHLPAGAPQPNPSIS